MPDASHAQQMVLDAIGDLEHDVMGIGESLEGQLEGLSPADQEREIAAVAEDLAEILHGLEDLWCGAA